MLAGRTGESTSLHTEPVLIGMVEHVEISKRSAMIKVFGLKAASWTCLVVSSTASGDALANLRSADIEIAPNITD
jgi:hypothetical protein